MPLLRIATSLMRRLSRSQATPLLGRILVTMASLFPLTDRSGVNMLGHFNAENPTQYEGSEADVADMTEALGPQKWLVSPFLSRQALLQAMPLARPFVPTADFLIERDKQVIQLSCLMRRMSGIFEGESRPQLCRRLERRCTTHAG